MAYKIKDVELQVIVQYCPVDWRKPVSEPVIVQVPPAAIDTRSIEVKSMLQSLLSIVVNLNKLPAQVLV